jgi:hypothetical protein
MKKAAMPTRARMTTTAATMPGIIEEELEAEAAPLLVPSLGLGEGPLATGAVAKPIRAADVADDESRAKDWALLILKPKESRANIGGAPPLLEASTNNRAVPPGAGASVGSTASAINQGIILTSTFGASGIAVMT